ncbi:hypothetical protein ACFODZ_09930 [Marinicella sediminis]|uniref:DUF3619 family protein n=1 Tax=Marinicella sediminis TaxID=1792834 RepID=A0ABV7J8U7_9GAMM|nr:hypothetical protein [Marinicella sediminis]
MKLTEQQLAQLMSQKSTQNNQQAVQASDCLDASPASSERLRQAEKLLDNHTTAQAMKAALAAKPWAQAVASDVQHRQQSWVIRLLNGSAMKWGMTAAAFAFVAMVAVPQLNQSVEQSLPLTDQNVANDMINSGHFDAPVSDQLNSGGFEPVDRSSKDRVSQHSFG